MTEISFIIRAELQAETSSVQGSSSKENAVKMFNYGNEVQTVNLSNSNLVSTESKAIVADAVKYLGIKPYSFSVMKDSHTAIAKSELHLIDLIKFYEGDRNHYYEGVTCPYEDKYGTSTCGFGTRTKKPLSPEDSYEKLTEKLKTSCDEVKNLLNNRCGKDIYGALPSSIKEGLIDLCYNKGLPALSQNSQLLEALRAKDYGKVVKNLAYVQSAKTDAPKVDDAGLYRRSLSRMILATRDLKGSALRAAKAEIEKLYENAKKLGGSKIDLNNVYEHFTKKTISGTNFSAVSAKYEVQKGDGLLAIARKIAPKNTSEAELKKIANEIKRLNHDVETLKEGVLINVPILKKNTASAPVQSSQSAPVENKKDSTNFGSYKVSQKTEKYVVEEKYSGKGYYALARDILSKYQNTGMSIKELSDMIIKFNGGNDTLTVGKEIVIPVFEKVSATSVSSNKPEATEQAEDTPSYVKSFNEIKKSKNTKFEQVGIKKDLTLITYPYEVKKGDTLYSLSNYYGTSVEELKRVNGFKNDSLKAGQTIQIKKLGYQVKKGDTLIGIANKFGLTTEILGDMNNIEDKDSIKVGDTIQIPGYVYTVQKGDNLIKIAKQVGVTLENLKSVNGLKTSTIQPDQKIVVLYNDSDYSVAEDKKVVTKDNVEYVNMEGTANFTNRPLLKKKVKVDGKVVATRAEFKPTSKGPLSGKTIIINAGHGYSQAATDVGTEGRDGLEDEWLLNYDNAMRLKDKLCAKGAKVIFLQGKVRLISKELKDKKNKADLFVSIHVNSHDQKTTDRTQIYYKSSESSKKLAEGMEKNFDKWIPKHEKISANDKFMSGGKQDYAQSRSANYEVLRVSEAKQKIPSVLWEVAFMVSPKGRARMADSKLMSNYAGIMSDSIVEYFENN